MVIRSIRCLSACRQAGDAGLVGVIGRGRADKTGLVRFGKSKQLSDYSPQRSEDVRSQARAS